MIRKVERGVRFHNYECRIRMSDMSQPSNGEHRHQWACICDAGHRFMVPEKRLRYRDPPRCPECRVLKETPNDHPVEYRAFLNMQQRCYNPNNRMWYRYGGRVIDGKHCPVTICDEWRPKKFGGKSNFWDFFKEIGERPSEMHSVDRIDNSRGYEKGNIRWASKLVQNQNRSFGVVGS